MRIVPLLVLVLGASACSGDEAPPPPPPAPAGGGGAAPGKPAAPKPVGNPLQPRIHVEERVACPEPEKATGPACNPGTPSCEAGLYCIPVLGGATHCEACPERDSIRHDFKDRDFVGDQVRDPFQSFIIVQKGMEPTSDKKVEGPCNRAEQFVATEYSYLDLRLVGIVSQGTKRKVLMIDRIGYGHIIRRGDCVGKEKAVVKDIGPGFVTFVVHPDPEDKSQRVPEERSMQLHPKGLQVAPQSLPEAMTPGTNAPIVAPPAAGQQPQPQPAPVAPVVPPPSR